MLNVQVWGELMIFRGWRKAGARKPEGGRGAGELGGEEMTYYTCEAAGDDS